MLGSPEGLLDGPKLLVTQHRFQRLQIGVRAQHEDDAVEPLVLLDLGLIDFDRVDVDWTRCVGSQAVPPWFWVGAAE